jgi:hypothetical protein
VPQYLGLFLAVHRAPRHFCLVALSDVRGVKAIPSR